MRLTRFIPRVESYLVRRRYSQAPQDRISYDPVWVPYQQAADLLTYEVEKEFARRAVTELEKVNKENLIS